MLGVLVNALAIFAGGMIGLLLKKGIPQSMETTVLAALGLCTLVIGIKGAFEGENTLVMILSLGIGSIIGSAYMNVMYNIAILHLHLALSSVLLGMFALWAIFLGRIFFKEKITTRKIVCVCLALFGVVLVSGALEQTDLQSISLFGIAVGLTAALMYAINGVTTRVMGNWGMDALTINFWYFLIAAISLLPLCHWDQVAAYVAASPAPNIAWLISQSLVCAIIPYVLFTIALNNMDIGLASTLELIEPAAGMVFGLVLFGEIPTPLMVVGVVVVIVALAMTFRSPQRTSTADE